MLDMGTAYRVDRSGYMDVDILDNRVSTHYTGMVLRFNDGAAFEGRCWDRDRTKGI